MVTILNCSKPKPGMENEHFSKGINSGILRQAPPRQCWILNSTPWIPDSSHWILNSLSVEYQNICGMKFSRYLFSARSEFGIFIVFFNEVFSSYVIRVNCVSYISCCQLVCSSFGSARHALQHCSV